MYNLVFFSLFYRGKDCFQKKYCIFDKKEGFHVAQEHRWTEI
jgi:hypothetical protein